MMILLWLLSMVVRAATSFQSSSTNPFSNSWMMRRHLQRRCITQHPPPPLFRLFKNHEGPSASAKRRRRPTTPPPRLPKPLPFDVDFVERQLRDWQGYRLTFELSSPLPDDQPTGDGPSPPPNAVLVLDRATAQNADDLRAIVEMNIREYGRGPAVLPLDNPKLLSRFVSRLLLITLIEWSMRCKLLRTADHVIYVAKFIDPTRSHRRRDKSNNNNDNSRNADYQYVGMIEVSLQPVLRQRNPPPFPIPLSVKRWIAQAHGVPIQGWISNLLVVPECRGAGYSKLLVRAAEAVAQREWGCDSMHLHCDADPVGGSIARELYATLGYDVLPNQQSYVTIDGVSLLYLSKSMSI